MVSFANMQINFKQVDDDFSFFAPIANSDSDSNDPDEQVDILLIINRIFTERL